MRPPSSSASRFDSGRPRPVPFTRRCSGFSICTNSSKIRDRSFSGMPMPVSATENSTSSRAGVSRDRHPHLAALGVLERVRDEVAQDLRQLALVGVDRRNPVRLLEHQRQRLVDEQRPQHAAQRAEQAADLERRRPDLDLAGFDLGEIEQVVDQIRQLLRRLADVEQLVLLARGGRPAVRRAGSSAPGSSSPASGTRGSCSRGNVS